MIHCFQSADALVEKLSFDFLDFIELENPPGKRIHIALSGGNSPRIFFEKIAINQYKRDKPVPWNKVHFFWADERCVPPEHRDSNYGMTRKILLEKINLEDQNVHRIMGENDPEKEVVRYALEIQSQVASKDGIPVFDWIILGIGEDGHTASIFPNRFDLLNSEQICAAVQHPETGQSRVTLTGRTILQARRITFLVTGVSKSQVVRQILNNEAEASQYPAGYIFNHRKSTDWYLDDAAAQYLKSSSPW